ncbi:MAG: AMIN domain-containing protein [Desulfuromonadaceae bacterium]|nr:AMIN domain-containing protein [Desulfuromonadaceae bacterium]
MTLYRLVGLLFCWCLTLSFAWGDDLAHRFQTLQNNYAQLLKSEQKRLKRDNWEKIISGFETFSREFPDHGKGPAGLFMAGRASQGLYRFSRRTEDARRAGRFFDRLDEAYPCHNLTDDALVMSAEIHEEILGDKKGAIERYLKVAHNHGHGDQVHLARKRLEALGSSYSSPPAKETAALPAKMPAPMPAHAPGPRRIEGIRQFDHGDFSRVVLDVSAPVEFSYNALPAAVKGGDPRLYVDMKGVTPPSESLANREIADPLVQRIRIGRPESDRIRVVLDLKPFKDYRVYALDNPSRVVIEVARAKQSWDKTAAKVPDIPPQTATQRAAGSAPPQVLASGRSAAVSSSPKKDEVSAILDKSAGAPCPVIPIPGLAAKNGPRRIVVDAGHGGKDPGAIGPGGVQEKDVVLKMAKLLAQRLKNEVKCEVILTRDKDVFIPLKERTAIANRHNADLFISVHANASLKRNLRGVETYYLNFSKNEGAASVAARENGTTLAEVGDLELILFDLMAHAKINESSLLADKVQKGIVSSLTDRYRDIQDNGVRQGPFHVLLGANMPSILVEVAFISNPKDESLLQTSKYQQGVVEGIVAGVKNFDHTLNRMAKR